MASLAKRVLVRPLAISLVLATIVGLGLPSFRGNAKPVEAGQPAQWPGSARAAAVLGFFAAEGRGDADAAAAEFAANGIWAAAGLGDLCSPAAPCSDAAGIRAQLEGNIGVHICHTIVELNVAGAVITGRMEVRNDGGRAYGVEHGIQSFLALVPQDKITYLTIVNDVGDPQTALARAILAGTQPAGPPIPPPTTPCG